MDGFTACLGRLIPIPTISLEVPAFRYGGAELAVYPCETRPEYFPVGSTPTSMSVMVSQGYTANSFALNFGWLRNNNARLRGHQVN